MTNKKVCDYCGTIYSAQMDKCPLCGNVEKKFESAEPARRSRTGTAGKRGEANRQKTNKDKKSKRASGDKMPKGLVVLSVILLAIAVLALTWHILAQWIPSLPSLTKVLQSTNKAEEAVYTQEDKHCWYLNCDADELVFTAAGDTKKLITDVQPADCVDELIFTSKNPEIATVDADGTITAVANGTTYVTVACGDLSYNVTVTCSFDAMAALNQVRLSFTERDETAALEILNLPDGVTVEWQSSDEDVAQVDEDGTVRAVDSGTCTISASFGGNTLQCAVTVSVEEPHDEWPQQGTINTNGVNYREEPSTDGTVIGYFDAGDEVVVTGAEDGWYCVEAYGTTGYVSDRFVDFEP